MPLYLHAASALILAANLLTGGAVARAQECNERTTKVYYLNGVDNTEQEALFSKNLLKGAYAAELAAAYPGETFEFDLLYNQTAGPISDLEEVFRQKILEGGDDELAQRAAALAFAAAGIIENTAKNLVEDRLSQLGLPGSVIAALLEASVEVASDRMLLVGDRLKFAELLESDLEAFRRVLVVSHSQGNLFAEASVDALRTELPGRSEGIGVVGIASPADGSIVAGDYFTAIDDRVINALRLIADVVRANVDNDPGILFDARDWRNHSFWESYFSPELLSRTGVDESVAALAEELTFFSVTGTYNGTFEVNVEGEAQSGAVVLTIAGSLDAFQGSFSLGGVADGSFVGNGLAFASDWSGTAGGDPAQGTISCLILLAEDDGACTPKIDCSGSGFTSEGSGSGSLTAFQ